MRVPSQLVGETKRERLHKNQLFDMLGKFKRLLLFTESVDLLDFRRALSQTKNIFGRYVFLFAASSEFRKNVISNPVFVKISINYLASFKVKFWSQTATK